MFLSFLVEIVHGTHKHFFFTKIFIKNGSYGTIHTFKNYFSTVFSVFNKISDIQTDPTYHKNYFEVLTITKIRLISKFIWVKPITCN